MKHFYAKGNAMPFIKHKAQSRKTKAPTRKGLLRYLKLTTYNLKLNRKLSAVGYRSLSPVRYLQGSFEGQFLRQVFECASSLLRDFFDTASRLLRARFDWLRGVVEDQSNSSRATVEQQSKKSANNVPPVRSRYQMALPFTAHAGRSVLILASYVLILTTLFMCPAAAQTPENSGAGQGQKAVDLTSLGIQIGEEVPDITITNLHNYKDKDGKPTTSAQLSDFRGKLLILDFWATWCSPCVAMIPRMDSLQKAFGDKVQFLSVTYQKDEEVLPFLEKLEKQKGKHYDIPVVTGDKDLHGLFPNNTLPHYVWIDGSGTVKAITGHEEVNAENFRKAIASPIKLVQKRDLKIAYDNTKPFLINGNGGDGSNLIYHSVFTGYTEGIPLGYKYTPLKLGEPRSINAHNLSMVQLFRLAYGGDRIYYGWNRVFIETSDAANLRSPAKGEAYKNWLKGNNAFCYELIVPSYLPSEAFVIMQNELKILFPKYSAQTQKRTVKCLVLKSIVTNDEIVAKGGDRLVSFSGKGFSLRNASLDYLTTRLEVLYLQNIPYPIVNGTNYDKVDLDVEANLSNLDDLNNALEKYNLKFVIDDWETDVLVIGDNKPENNRF